MGEVAGKLPRPNGHNIGATGRSQCGRNAINHARALDLDYRLVAAHPPACTTGKDGPDKISHQMGFRWDRVAE